MSCVVAVLAAARVSGDETETHTRSNAESASARDSPSSRRCSETAQARSAPTAATAYVCAEPLEAAGERRPSGIADAHAQSASTNARHDPSAASSKSVFTSSRGDGFVRRVASSFASFVAPAFAARFSPSRSVPSRRRRSRVRARSHSRTRGPPLTFPCSWSRQGSPRDELVRGAERGLGERRPSRVAAAASARVAESANRRARRFFCRLETRLRRSFAFAFDVNLSELEPRTSRASVTSLPPLSGVLAFGSTATSSSTSRRNCRHASFSGFTLWNVQGAFSRSSPRRIGRTCAAHPPRRRSPPGSTGTGASPRASVPPAPAAPAARGVAGAGVARRRSVGDGHRLASRSAVPRRPRVSRSGGPRDGRSVAAAGVPPRLPRVRTRVRV